MITEDRKASQDTKSFFNELSRFQGEFNRVIMETEYFVIIPTLGMLVEGWLLISPKRHILNFSQLTDKEWLDYRRLQKRLNLFFVDCYSLPTYFEHGPSRKNSIVGCGVDYAHMHVVPLPFDLMRDSTLAKDYLWSESKKALNCDNLLRGASYLYISNHKGSFLAVDQDFPSQTIRKAIAECSRQPEYWDWKEFHFTDNINNTVGAFNSWMLSQE